MKALRTDQEQQHEGVFSRRCAEAKSRRSVPVTNRAYVAETTTFSATISMIANTNYAINRRNATGFEKFHFVARHPESPSALQVSDRLELDQQWVPPVSILRPGKAGTQWDFFIRSQT
jgi:hypothetical protein